MLVYSVIGPYDKRDLQKHSFIYFHFTNEEDEGYKVFELPVKPSFLLTTFLKTEFMFVECHELYYT